MKQLHLFSLLVYFGQFVEELSIPLLFPQTAVGQAGAFQGTVGAPGQKGTAKRGGGAM